MIQERLVSINNQLVQYYKEKLVERRDGPVYLLLHKLGLSDLTIRDYQLGYAPDDLSGFISFAEKNGISVEELLEAGQLKKEDQLKLLFSDRIMIPILDANDDPVGFCGRRIDKNESPVYLCKVPEDSRLIGLHIAKETKKDYLILCDGLIDPMLFYEKGYVNAVGYYNFGEKQAETIGKYAKRVIVVPDHDSYGKNLGSKVCKLLHAVGVQADCKEDYLITNAEES